MALLLEKTTSGREYKVKDMSQEDLSLDSSRITMYLTKQLHQPPLPTSFAFALLSSSITDRPNSEERQGNQVVSLPADSRDPAADMPGPSSCRLPIPKRPQNLVDGGVIESDGGVIESEGSCRCFSLDEVLKATNDFDDALVVGKGGFGVVYKGVIDNGATSTTTVVAMKRLDAKSKQGAEEFWMEVNLLSKFHHANLVSLIGYCNENQEMILVYEFIAHGTLASHLYKSSKEGSSSKSRCHLKWAQRLNILIGAARGLNYLHTGTEVPTIHRDVKSTNILLDENWVTKVSDFGICKPITSQTTTHVTTEVKATRGYLDPDYFATNQVTRKSDVYAFGVVMLEVLCARPPIDESLEEKQINLSRWSKKQIKRKRLDRIIDPSLNGEITPQSLKYFAELAYDCLQDEPKGRPTMSKVVVILEIALLYHERGSQGKITKPFHARQFMPKGMNSQWGERRLDCFLARACRRFSLDEICDATNKFDEDLLISEEDGWFKLYKGYAVMGTPVMAIKRYDSMACFEECLAEIRVHSLNRHANITSLIGFCDEDHELILVYDYMLNGTLRSHLYEPNNGRLHWKQRLEICIDIARGLVFLHTNTQQQFIHVNLKSSAVYLYDKWVAKIADFEISKKIDTRLGTEYSCEGKCGTFGYLDPEYSTSGYVTKKSDVYSCGILLLEILCAKRPCDLDPNGGEVLEWVQGCMDSGTINEIIDPYLVGKIAPDCLLYFVSLAITCLSKEGIQRPCMDVVLCKLQSSLNFQEDWENPHTDG